MRLDIAWWDLDESRQTIESLREHLRSGATNPWEDLPGLRLKLWMADRVRNRWGAMMLWESERPPMAALPPNLAGRLIGCPLTHRAGFDVEAVVEGRHSLPSLHRLGLAFAP